MQKKEIVRTLKFLLFSISAGLIQIALFTLLNEWILTGHYWLSYLIALVASVLWNFTFNRRFTFRSAANVPVPCCSCSRITVYSRRSPRFWNTT